MNAKRMLVWVWLLLAPALGAPWGTASWASRGPGRGWGRLRDLPGGGPGRGVLGRAEGVRGVFLAGAWLPVGPGVFLLPALGLGGESGGFLLDLGVRGFWFFREEGGWAFGVGAGYALPLGSSRGGWYVRLAFGGGRP